MRVVVVLLFLAFNCAYGGPPPDYYVTAEGKTGSELRQALHLIIRNHRAIPYSSSGTDTRAALKVLDEQSLNTNNVVLIYSGFSDPKSGFGLTTGWNREHLWPNSDGLDDTLPSFTDLQNLRACDTTVNSARGNKVFDVSNPLDPNYRNLAHLEAPLCSTDTDSWEPRDEEKGDIARALFYMAVRYTGDAPHEPALKLTDHIELISSTNTCMGRLSTLLKWNAADPVDAREQLRNDLIYSLYQTNRNPFIDHPEWVNLAFGPQLTITFDAPTELLRIAWPSDFVGATLETSTDAVSSWSIVTNIAVLTNNNWRIERPVAGPFVRFRLRLN
jgi:endonuclease I